MSCVPLASAAAADLSVTPVLHALQLGPERLAAGAGSDFESPAVTDVLLAMLTITGTGGASWQLQVEMSGGEALLLDGVSLALKREGAEPGISGGLDYRVISPGAEELFSGSGDHAAVAILLRIAGVSAARPPAAYTPTLRYSIVMR